MGVLASEITAQSTVGSAGLFGLTLTKTSKHHITGESEGIYIWKGDTHKRIVMPESVNVMVSF